MKHSGHSGVKVSMKNVVISVLVLTFLFSVTVCSSAASGNNTSGLLRYPVVLVHGIAAHDRESRIDYWGRIPETLRGYGVEVFFGNTDSWGSFESNASILKKTIGDILAQTGHERVNIIAHSKGGLDSRYLIWRYNFGDRVASLTTISTPHHGAELADFIYEQGIIHTPMARHFLEVLGQLFADQQPDLFRVLQQLTSVNMKNFNEKVQKDERVYYQSLFTVMNKSIDDLVFFSTFLYLRRVSGPNDGMVSERSATWGNNSRRIAEGVSHRQIIDIGWQNVIDTDITSLYVDIIHGLAVKGF